jgi:hypothetical protein
MFSFCDLEGALSDLDEALRIHRWRTQAHESKQAGSNGLQSGGPHSQQHSSEIQLASDAQHATRRPSRIVLSEAEQPSSLEHQLLFQRGGIHLAIACNRIPEALQTLAGLGSGSSNKEAVSGTATPTSPTSPLLKSNGPAAGTPWPKEGVPQNDMASLSLQERQAQTLAHKAVRLSTRKAIRDYLSFLGNFEYSPNVPVGGSEEQTTNHSDSRANRSRRTATSAQAQPGTEVIIIHPVSDLFKETPPVDLPAFPSRELAPYAPNSGDLPIGSTVEVVTYHPLLIEALHSLLLCHTVAQTSAKELQRHAYMVARLTRLTDGYPVFQASRSPAKSDWQETLKRTRNWLGLSSDWKFLCSLNYPPAEPTTARDSMVKPQLRLQQGPAPPKSSGTEKATKPSQSGLVVNGASGRPDTAVEGSQASSDGIIAAAEPSSSAQRNGDINPAIPLPAVDRASASLPDKGSRDGLAEKTLEATPRPRRTASVDSNNGWSAYGGRRDPEKTDRAAWIARWVLEAPTFIASGTGSSSSAAGKRRKKKAPARGAGSALGLSTLPDPADPVA